MKSQLKRVGFVNFATENFQKKNMSKLAKKVVEVKGTRYLWGHMAFVAAEGNMNMELTLTYPIVPNSPSLTS